LKLLQRHILWELIRVFTMLLVGLTVMLVFVGLLQEATDRGLGVRQILQIMPYVVPSLLPFTIPATLLLAITVVYGRMAGDLEVTAAKSAGVNPLHLLVPAFGLGAVLTVASFVLTNRAIPWAIGNIEAIATQALEDIFLDGLEANNVFVDSQGGFSVTVTGVKDRVLINPTFIHRNSNHRQVSVRADTAQLKFDLDERKLKLRLTNARISSQSGVAGFFRDHELEFDLKQELGHQKARHLTVVGIAEQIEVLKKTAAARRLQHDQEIAMHLMTGDFEQLQGDESKRYLHEEHYAEWGGHRMNTEMHSRYAMAGSCLFFAFLGGPFAVLQARRQFITSFIMCFLPILLVYYPATFLMANLSKSGSIEAWWSVWVPNLIIGTAAFFVLRRVIRH